MELPDRSVPSEIHFLGARHNDPDQLGFGRRTILRPRPPYAIVIGPFGEHSGPRIAHGLYKTPLHTVATEQDGSAPPDAKRGGAGPS